MDKLRQSVVSRETTFGTWLTISNPVTCELIARSGYDWVIVDTQHGAVTWDSLLPTLQVLDITGTPALVRTGWNDPMQIMRALDLGARGVVVPMVSTAEQAKAAAAAAHYPPDGIRSFGPVRLHYVASAIASDPLCIVMIETVEGLENLEEIASTPNVDGLLVGPVDLALSLGLGFSRIMPPQVVAAIARVVDACRRHGKLSACASLGPENAEAMTKLGVNFVALGNDAMQIRKGAAADLEQARGWTATLQSTD